MQKHALLLALLAMMAVSSAQTYNASCASSSKSLYDMFDVTLLNGTTTTFDKNKLNILAEKYFAAGLRIVGFPSPDFDNQEPGMDDEILHCLKYVRPGEGFVPAFPLASKSNVNPTPGQTQNPLFAYVQTICPCPIPGAKNAQYSWNFVKLLVDSNGMPVRRYTPATDPIDIEADIIALLDEAR